MLVVFTYIYIETPVLCEADLNIVFVRLDNEPVSTGQREIGARLLSPFGNRHFS
jgi:hypothetical protein